MAVKPLTSALKIFDVLEVIGQSPKPLRLADVARSLGEPRAATHQRLVTLVHGGLIEQLDDGRYRLAWRIVRYAGAAADQADFGERLIDILKDMVARSGETASFMVLDRGSMVILQRVESRGVLRPDLRVGAALPLDISAAGRVVAAAMSDEERARLAALGAALPDEATLEEVRRRGYAVSGATGPRTVTAVAAPVRDKSGRCVGALTISGPTAGFDKEACARVVLDAAAAAELRFRGEQS